MTTDEALDLALEALEGMAADLGKSESDVPAITAIKQARALDKKAENARELGLDYEPAEALGHNGWGFPIKAAAPVQEPVAFFDWYDNAHWGNEDFKEGCHRSWNAAIKYTTPPAAQRPFVGLTDEEIDKHLSEDAQGDCEMHEFARAIEAKLKERNV